MIMEGRSFSASEYRFGFNGKEKEDEPKGYGNSYDFGDRIYDPRIGKWLSIDFLSTAYAPITPFAFSLNNPIAFRDLDGNVVVGSDGNPVTYSVESGQIVWSSNATADIKRIGNAMLKTGTGTKQFNQMMNSTIKVHLKISPKAKFRYNEKGEKVFTYGETLQGNSDEKDNYGKFTKEDGTFGIKEATIVIYEGSFKEVNSKNENYGLDNFTVDELIGVVGTHESVHATDVKEIHEDIHYEVQNAGKSRPSSLREAKPEKIESHTRIDTKILQERKKKNVK